MFTTDLLVQFALRWAGHLARMEQSRHAYRILVRKPEAKSPSGRPRRRWEDNIKMDLREVGCDAGDWISISSRWGAIPDLCKSGNEPPNFLNANWYSRSIVAYRYSIPLIRLFEVIINVKSFLFEICFFTTIYSLFHRFYHHIWCGSSELLTFK